MDWKLQTDIKVVFLANDQEWLSVRQGKWNWVRLAIISNPHGYTKVQIYCNYHRQGRSATLYMRSGL